MVFDSSHVVAGEFAQLDHRESKFPCSCSHSPRVDATLASASILNVDVMPPQRRRTQRELQFAAAKIKGNWDARALDLNRDEWIAVVRVEDQWENRVLLAAAGFLLPNGQCCQGDQ